MAEFEPADKDSTLIAALAALFGGIIAIVVYLLKPSDRFVKFYALQQVATDIAVAIIAFALYALVIAGMIAGAAGSAVAGGAAPLISMLSFLPMACLGVGALAYIVFRLYSVYMAFTGNVFKVPVIGNFIAKYV